MAYLQIEAQPSGAVGFSSATSSPGLERETELKLDESQINISRKRSPLSLRGWHGDAVEDVEIGAFDSDCEEGERFGLLTGADELRRSPPIVGRFTVADQENPRAVVRDAVQTVRRLAVAYDLNGLLNRLPHRRAPLRGG